MQKRPQCGDHRARRHRRDHRRVAALQVPQPRLGQRIADRPDVATRIDHREDTRLPGRHPARRAAAAHDRFRDRGHLRGASGLQCDGRHLHARTQRWHDDHAWPEHARGLPGRVVRQPLRTCPRGRDDVGDLRSRADPDHVGWRDRHVRGLRDRARRHDSGSVDAAECRAIRIPVRRADTEPDADADGRAPLADRPRPRRQPARRPPPPRLQARHRLRRRRPCRPRRRHRLRNRPRRRPRLRRRRPSPPLPRPRRRRRAATSSARAGSSRRTRRAIPSPGPTSLPPSARSTPSRSQRTGRSARRPTATC